MTRGLLPQREEFAFHPQFWVSDEHEVTRGLLRDVQHSHFTTVLSVRRARGLSPAAVCQTYPAQFRRGTVILRSLSQQPFSAALLSSLSALLSSLSQQLFSAALPSSFSQQLFAAAFLSSLSQQLFSTAFLSSISQQLFSAVFLQLSSCCGQGLVVSY